MTADTIRTLTAEQLDERAAAFEARGMDADPERELAAALRRTGARCAADIADPLDAALAASVARQAADSDPAGFCDYCHRGYTNPADVGRLCAVQEHDGGELCPGIIRLA